MAHQWVLIPEQALFAQGGSWASRAQRRIFLRRNTRAAGSLPYPWRRDFGYNFPHETHNPPHASRRGCSDRFCSSQRSQDQS
jgi:hypothetical protein